MTMMNHSTGVRLSVLLESTILVATTLSTNQVIVISTTSLMQYRAS